MKNLFQRVCNSKDILKELFPHEGERCWAKKLADHTMQQAGTPEKDFNKVLQKDSSMCYLHGLFVALEVLSMYEEIPRDIHTINIWELLDEAILKAQEANEYEKIQMDVWKLFNSWDSAMDCE
jgi:3-methyladenine DNA glycosylase AlkD